MSTVWRTLDRALLRDVGTFMVAGAMIGVSFGAIAVAAGLPWWLAVTMSALVFAGGSQFMAIGMLAAGSPAGAVLGGLLLNARHLPFGFTVAGLIGSRWPVRLLGTHLMIDESVAFALAQQDPERRRAAYWLVGGGLFVAWNLGTGLGAWLGGVAGDPAAWGVDAAFPAALLALILPSLREPTTRRVAGIGAGVAVLTTAVLPAGLPVLASLVGLVVAIPGLRRGARPAGPPDAAGGDSDQTRGAPDHAPDHLSDQEQRS